MMRNSRGEFELTPVIFLVMTTMILVGLLMYHVSTTTASHRNAGEISAGVITAYNRGEALYRFVEDSARVSIKNAVRDVYAKGGLSNTTCGQLGEYVLVNTPTKQCYSTDFTNHVIASFRDDFESYLIPYSRATGLALSPGEYEYYLDDTTLVGIALRPITISIPLYGAYYARPSFHIPYTNELRPLSDLAKTFDTIRLICGNERTPAPCVTYQVSLLKSSPAEISVTFLDNNHYGFTIINPSLPVVKLALYLPPSLPPTPVVS